MKPIYWGEYTSFEMKKFIEKEPVVLVPVGAYEQHGPHLAMNTDTTIGESICKSIVGKSAVPCTMLPPVWVGISEHHMEFSGSLTLQQSTMTALLWDILDSLGRNGIKNTLVVNSHGGNIVPLNEALTRISQKYEGTWALLTYWNLISKEIWDIRKSEYGGVSHACEMETSLLYYIDEDGVRKNRIPDSNNVKGSKWWSPEMFGSNKIAMYKPFSELTKDGHIGDPKLATKEAGETIHNLIVDKSLPLIEAIWKGELLDEDS